LPFELFTVNSKHFYNNIISLTLRIQGFLKTVLVKSYSLFHVSKRMEMKELMNEWKKQSCEKKRNEKGKEKIIEKGKRKKEA
jgi:phosphoribosyl-dephospho-CoA transferase